MWPGGLGRLRATLSPTPSIGVNGSSSHAPSIGVNGSSSHAPSIGVNGSSSHAPSIGVNGRSIHALSIGVNGSSSHAPSIGVNGSSSHAPSIGINEDSSHAPSAFGPALCAAFDATGSRLAVGHWGGAVCVHRVPWGSPPLVLPAASGHVTSLAWAGPCALVGGGASGSLWLWAWPRLGSTPSSSSHHHFRPRPPRELPLGRGGVRAMGGAEGRVVVATDDGSVAVMGAMGQPHTWGAPRETLWIRPHLGPTECVGLSPTGAALATGGADGAVAVWGVGDAVGLKRRWLRAHSDGVCAVGWTGDLLVSGGCGGSLSLWAVVSGQRLRTLEGLRGAPSALGGEGRWVLAVSRDGSLAAWEGAELVGHVGGRGQSRGDIAPPGRRQPLVAVVGPDELTHLWEPLKEPRPITLCSAGGAEVVGVAVAGHAPSASSHAPAFNANGSTAADHARTAADHAHPASGHAHSVSGYAYPRSSHAPFSGFGHAPSAGSGHAPPVAVAAASDGSVRVIPLPPPESPPPPDLGAWGRGRVTSLAWNPAGSHVVAGGAGGTLSLWGEGLEAEAKVAAPPISALLFRNANEILVAAGKRLELWELRGRRLLPMDSVGRLPLPVLQLLLPQATPPPATPPPVLLLLGEGQLWQMGRGAPRPLRIVRREPLPHSVEFLLELLRSGKAPPPSSQSPPTPSSTPELGIGTPWAVKALPEGSVLVWGGEERPRLSRLVPEGEGWVQQWAELPDPPLPRHGHTRWFTGAELVPGAGMFLSRSDGTLWLLREWGQPWIRRRVSGRAVTSLRALRGRLLTTAMDGTARLWSPRGGHPEAHYRCAGPVTCSAVQPGDPSSSDAIGIVLGDEWGHVYRLLWGPA